MKRESILVTIVVGAGSSLLVVRPGIASMKGASSRAGLAVGAPQPRRLPCQTSSCSGRPG